ncbi:outer membrane immunogenic protein [Methylovirgula ligni]|uniref:Outer membrane immunogenic protein n=1 Tax=Methylovirgula ligni TaxID=569860 RepID=A0A3D9YWX7_9HYPH|nr:outer membrane immunogenic protein [Methylovirgula ligni]
MNAAIEHADTYFDELVSFLQKSLSKIWLFSCVLLQIGAFGFCAPAQAADLPSDKEPALAPAPLPPAPFSWTGFYAGVNGGFGLDHYAFTYSYFPPGVAGQGAKSGITSSGPLIGGQIGYNYELTNLPIIDHAIIGIEADEQWTDFHGAVDIPVSNGIFHIGTQLENYGSLRSRVGYNFDRLLFYFTGGFAYSVTKNYYTAGALSGSRTQFRSGLFPSVGIIGIGAEYALTDHFTVRAEYFYNFTGAHYADLYQTPTSTIGFGTRSMYHIARVGLNYKFDSFGGAPVVAKY